MSKPHVVDSKLGQILDRIYRSEATVGSGSTAAAIRHEMTTGGCIKGKYHSQKGRQIIREL